MNCTKITARISLAIVLFALFSFQATQAQEVSSNKKIVLESDTTYITLEHQFGIGSPHMTGNQKTETHRVFTEKIQERFPGVDTKDLTIHNLAMTDPNNWSPACKENNRWGDNANYPHAITDKATLEKCANVNEIHLGWMRAEMVKSFLIEQGWVDPLRVHTGVYGYLDTTSDGKPTRRTVMFAVIKHNSKELSEMPEIIEINENVSKTIEVLNDNTVQTNANTDSLNSQQVQIYDNESGIEDLERRVADLERDRLVSGHIGLSGQYFASELVPAAEIGLSVGQFEFAGFIGYLPNAGVADLDEGPADYHRSQIGWSATWYALAYEDLRIGPMIGFEWARDDIDAIDCEIIYQSPLAGIATDIALTEHISLYGNVTYAPTSVQVTGNLEKDVSDVQIRAGIRLNF